jgi:hypothetical protein
MSWIVSACLLFVIPCIAQTQPRPGGPPEPPARAGRVPSTGDSDETQEHMAHDMVKKANLARQAVLRTDTDKLLKLAVELKDYVDKSNENVLSVEVVRKAEEIEKLAHSVKDKMKGPN